jgi:Virulence factor
MAGSRPRIRTEVVVIWWRDIPAQVNAQAGRERHQVLLEGRFQRAIDRAKRKAGIDTAADDIAQWRRVTHPLVGDPAEAAADMVSRIEQSYPRERLGLLAFAGGFERDVDALGALSEGTISREALAALDELDDGDGDGRDDPSHEVATTEQGSP